MIIKYIGAVLLLAASILIIREYKRFVDIKLKILISFSDFLSHVERLIKNSLTPASELYRGFDTSTLGGFLLKIKVGESLYEAYTSFSDRPHGMADEILGDYFAGFGKGDRESELLRVASAKAKLDAAIDGERAEGEKSKKLFGTLAVSIALAVTILLI